MTTDSFLPAIVLPHVKGVQLLRLRGEKETKASGVSTLLVYQADYSSKEDGLGLIESWFQVPLIGISSNHRNHVEARIYLKLVA